MNLIEKLISSIFSDVGVYDAILVTFRMAITSTLLSSVLGIVMGLALERVRFPGKKAVIRINRTLMGVPPVVVGLFVYMLIMRRGPLGFAGLLFTVRGMVLAQTLIITPIICGMTYSYAAKEAPAVRVFAQTMGATRLQTDLLLLKEMKYELYFAALTGFGRSISEVGAVMLVGGNIKGNTRTMTTAIALLKSQGIFHEGMTLGVLLLGMAFIIQCLADFFQKGADTGENY